MQTVRLRPRFPRRQSSWKPLSRRAAKAYEIQRVGFNAWPCCRCQLPVEAHSPIILRICAKGISKLLQSLASFRFNCFAQPPVIASSTPEGFHICSGIPRPHQKRRLGQLFVRQLRSSLQIFLASVLLSQCRPADLGQDNLFPSSLLNLTLNSYSGIENDR